jgi:hypothetical protein
MLLGHRAAGEGMCLPKKVIDREDLSGSVPHSVNVVPQESLAKVPIGGNRCHGVSPGVPGKTEPNDLSFLVLVPESSG